MRYADEVAAQYRAAGFRLIRHNKHLRWACPCGHTQVSTSHSPSRGHGKGSGDLALLRRTKAECARRQQEEKTA